MTPYHHELIIVWNQALYRRGLVPGLSSFGRDAELTRAVRRPQHLTPTEADPPVPAGKRFSPETWTRESEPRVGASHR